MGVRIEEAPYGDWDRCYRLSNGELELVVTAQVGPRIVHLSVPGGPNLFCNVAKDIGQTGGDSFRLYGGHRFWHAPEHPVRTYYPDNVPVAVTVQADGVVVTQPTETTTRLQKELEIRLAADTAQATVTHRLTNHGPWAVELAPWALSVMTVGATAIVPLPPRGSHPEDLLPSSTLTLWPYSNLADPRWTWGERYILLRQDDNAQKPQKLGAFVPDGWVAAVVHDTAFVKRFEVNKDATYPDRNSTIEIFTNNFMLELETLGPLARLEPGRSVDYVERWQLIPNVPAPRMDADVDTRLRPRLVG